MFIIVKRQTILLNKEECCRSMDQSRGQIKPVLTMTTKCIQKLPKVCVIFNVQRARRGEQFQLRNCDGSQSGNARLSCLQEDDDQHG